jgi:hypothetical protein
MTKHWSSIDPATWSTNGQRDYSGGGGHRGPSVVLQQGELMFDGGADPSLIAGS